VATRLDHGKGKVPQRERCRLRKSNQYPTLHLALRDFRTANGRNPATGAGAGNQSWIALTLGMVVLDTLTEKKSKDEKVERRWLRLLERHGISKTETRVIYQLRCSVLHGYGLPKPAKLGGRRMLLTDDIDTYALDSKGQNWLLSVPVFCNRLVEHIAFEARNDWDVQLLDTALRFG
jgi:hypothetical protein